MDGWAVLVSTAITVAASPYLARLTLTVPDRDEKHWLRGRRSTRARTALTALAAAALGALAGGAAGWTILLPAFIALALTGAPLTIIDFEHHRLPNRLVYPAAAAAAILFALSALVRDDWGDYLRGIEAAAAVYVVLYVIHLVGTFGLGDVRLGAVLGAYLGWDGWVSVYYGIFGGFVLGSVVSLVLIASRRASLKTALAFGPMLLFGALIVLAFGLTPTVGGS